jgi:F0F1-type ATP synthase assembly protein I
LIFDGEQFYLKPMDKKALAYVALAFELAGLVVVCIFIGKYLDEKFSLNGLGIAGGALMGLILWVIHVTVVLRTYEREDAIEEKMKTK